MITTAEYQRTEREIALHAGKKGWTVHVAVYAVVMTGLVVLNLLIAARTESNFIWFPFPLVGWGIGRTMHYLHGVRWTAARSAPGKPGLKEWQVARESVADR